MASLINTLENTDLNDLLRAYKSEKEYLYFNVSVFNVGASIFIKCTNNFKEINPNKWNGYDFIIENDSTTKYYIQEVLKTILNDFTIVKTDLQTKKIKKIIK
jgi:hypothetical protein